MTFWEIIENQKWKTKSFHPILVFVLVVDPKEETVSLDDA